MRVVVPMAGQGERYRRAGHELPKPLIDVDGAPMIVRVIDDLAAVAPDARWLFVILRAHDEQTPLRRVLLDRVPGAEVVAIDAHRDGPIATLLAVADRVDPDEPMLLSYCDYGVRWDARAFRAWCEAGAWDAAMSAYRGFHPHGLGPTRYASMRVEESPATAPGARVLEIREKHQFTDDKMGEYASSGLFWCRRGGDLLDAARAVVADGERVAGEFYVATAMQRLVAAGKRVGVYPLDRFYQWGTAEDLDDYTAWARAMRSIDGFLADVARASSRSVHVIPMAGLGERFSRAGVCLPKPLAPVAGAPMFERAIQSLPVPARRVLVARAEHTRAEDFVAALARLPGATEVVSLDALTDGQATSAALGAARVDADSPLLIAPCDGGYLYDPAALAALEADAEVDVAVFSAKGHLPARWRPAMYGWLTADAARRVEAVAVKELVPGVDPARQEVLTGTFWFRSRALYDALYARLRASGERVRGELYVDAMARLAVADGLRVRAFAVEKFIPWGTPEELATFDYWNDVFRGARPLGYTSR